MIPDTNVYKLIENNEVVISDWWYSFSKRASVQVQQVQVHMPQTPAHPDTHDASPSHRQASLVSRLSKRR